MRVAYLGPQDTFTHLAALKQFGAQATYVGASSLEGVFEQVQQGTCEYAIVPVENSIEGAVTHTLDLLPRAGLPICGEIFMPIHHYLVRRKPKSHNTRLRRNPRGGIGTVYSHPQALGQCRHWLARHLPRAHHHETASTAVAIEYVLGKRKVMGESLMGGAAIGTSTAAQHPELLIVAKSIQDHKKNVTRFLIMGMQPLRTRSRRYKTSMYFALKDRPGALHDALVPFKRNKINLMKIESRPSKVKAWEYVFFVDFGGRETDTAVQRALTGLRKQCTALQTLGTYVAAQVTR
jgi:chorismate mutase / prephenate dehydratase